VGFVFNPKTPDETKVFSHVIVVNTEDANTLLEMSVLGKIGLITNPYKGRVKYYVNWREPNARKAYLKSTFPVDRPLPAFVPSSSVIVELFAGISATTEALLRAGIKIKKLCCCKIDPKARAVTKSRASNWLQVFPELLQPTALEDFHSFLPQNVERIENSHVLAMEKPDLIVASFPCRRFSRASGQTRGLADPRTHLLTEALRVIHLIHRRRGHCGWLIENVDATDHPIDSVRRDFNEFVKRLLGEGVAYDAILVGSYAHRYWRYWRNLIPGPLLHEMVEKRFLMCSVD
jgi:hypothetical protein